MHEGKKAAALRYDRSLPAPFLLAKGKGELAVKIIALAEKSDIPVYSEQTLTEALFLLEIGEMIPEDLYEVIALILSYTYGLQEQYENN